jgi:hypothetical protein
MTLAEAFRKLFQVDINRYEPIKHSLNSLIKSKLIVHIKEPLSHTSGGRNRIWILPDQLDTLNNAVLLHGIFWNTRTISKIFKDKRPFTFRYRMAEMTKIALSGRQLGVALLPRELDEFLNLLGSEVDLKSKRLPNPFHDLPQLSEDREYGIIQQMLTQSALLSNGDNMMLHYLNGDLQQAKDAAQSIDMDDPRLGPYRAMIEREYREASEFDALLDILK